VGIEHKKYTSKTATLSPGLRPLEIEIISLEVGAFGVQDICSLAGTLEVEDVRL
jgi:hypothetical protein